MGVRQGQPDSAQNSHENEVTKMGLFDVFSKGGKYFGKAIEPKCEYCEHGKRSSDGNKVLCTKKGMVDAGYHCPKFTYSPLKRIPVKQMQRVGWLEGDYDEKEEREEPVRTQTAASAPAAAAPAASAPAAPAPAAAAPAAPAPAAPAPAVNAAPVSAPKPAAAPAPKPAVPKAAGDLASLAAMADKAGGYVPEQKQDDGMNTLSSM